MSLSRRELLASLGLGALSACAAGQTAPQPVPPAPRPGGTKGMTPQELGEYKARMAAPNPLGVTQSGFQRRCADGLKPTDFAKFVRTQLGVGLVSWSGPLMGGAQKESMAALRVSADEQNVRSVLVDPAIGPGLASADASTRAAALERLKPWLEAARTLSAVGLSIDLRGQGDYDAQLAGAVAGVRAALPLFQSAGLQAVVKCLGGYTSHGQFLAALMNQVADVTVRLEPTFDSWKVAEGEEYHRNRGMELLMPFAACVLADYEAFNAEGESTRFPTRYLVQRVREPGFRGPVMMQFKGPGDELEGTLKIKSLLTRYPFKP